MNIVLDDPKQSAHTLTHGVRVIGAYCIRPGSDCSRPGLCLFRALLLGARRLARQEIISRVIGVPPVANTPRFSPLVHRPPPCLRRPTVQKYKMLVAALTCGRRTLAQSRGRARGAWRLSSSAEPLLPLLSRDVFVIEDDIVHFSGKSSSLKHPASKHTAATYAKQLFENSKYDFNSLGEFSLNLSAAAVWGPTRGAKAASSRTAEHSVILWPDRLILRNLCAKDVAAVLKASLQTSLIDSRGLEKQLSEGATVETMKGMVVVASCTGSQGFSHDRAKQTLAWFEAAGETHNNSATLVLAEDMRSHRSGTHVLVLRDSGEEDGYELQLSSHDRVLELVKKYSSERRS